MLILPYFTFHYENASYISIISRLSSKSEKFTFKRNSYCTTNCYSAVHIRITLQNAPPKMTATTLTCCTRKQDDAV